MTSRPADEPRVAHVVPALFHRGDGVIGGAERYALELARAMASHVPTELITFGNQPRTERVGDLEIRVLRAWRVRGQAANPFHPSLLRALRPATVIHCHQRHVVASSVSAAYARFTGRKVFVSDLGGGGWDLSAYVSTERWYHGHLHISAYSKRVAGHDGNERAHVIYGGVDVEKFSPGASAPEHPDRVVFVGRLLGHKGVNYLIEGLPEGLSLDVIGSLSDDRHARDLERGAEGKPVRFRHDCNDDDLIVAYRSALCVVLPSVYRDMYGGETAVPELLGQTPLEGMSCGIPAVVTDVASLPEVVVDGKTGFVVPPNDAEAISDRLSRLRDHPAEARAMGSAAREHVATNFAWPAVVRRCLEIYRQ